MPRKLRFQYPGALYHVFNRGNYRRDIFRGTKTAAAFEVALGEAAERHGWRIHAYVVMRNHYHLALETPAPNLVEGMHWLQCTFATRFNRLRSEHGHLFQGRYHSLLVEDAAALTRVVNYIHLNPVRAKVVSAERIMDFRPSSLVRFVSGEPPGWLVAQDFLGQLGLEASARGWGRYRRYLAGLALDPTEQERQGFPRLTRDWAIGTPAWRQALARAYAHRAMPIGLPAADLRDLKRAKWQMALEAGLRRCGKTRDAVRRAPGNVPWKLEIAIRLRREAGAPHRWIADALRTGTVGALRVALHRHEARL